MKANLLVLHNGKGPTGVVDINTIHAMVNTQDGVRFFTYDGDDHLVDGDIGLNLYGALQGQDTYTHVNEQQQPVFLVRVPSLVAMTPKGAPLGDKFFDVLIKGGAKFQIDGDIAKTFLDKLQEAANANPQNSVGVIHS